MILDRPDKSVVELLGQKEYASIESVNSQGSGLVSALNTGLEHSKFELIARLDSDDYMASNRLSIQSDFMNDHPEIGLIGSQIRIINKEGGFRRISSYPEAEQDIIRLLQFKCVFAHPSIMYRKSLVKEIGGYRQFYTYAEDYDLWIRISEKSGVRNLNNPLTTYREHENQVSKKYGRRQALATEASRVSARLRLKESPDLEQRFSDVYDWSKSKFALFARVRIAIRFEFYKTREERQVFRYVFFLIMRCLIDYRELYYVLFQKLKDRI